MNERSPARPIFVVGSPRSGTTLLRLILDSHSNISCGPETHLIAEMDGVGLRHWHHLERYGEAKEYWHAKCRRLFDEMKWDYAATKNKGRWADKTPSNALHMPFLKALYPDAQVIHTIRDARLVTASAFARWGWRSAWDMPPVWTASVTGARAFGAEAPADYREIRFEELTADIEGTLRPLFEWLGEPWEPAVVDYDRFAHDGGGTGQTSVAARSANGTAIDATRATTPRKALDPVLRTRVQRVTGRLNRELGYT